MQVQSWAQTEFGGACLGDKRRTRRLVSMAERLEESPGGRITDVYPEGAEREGSFRLLEGAYAQAGELERARGAACMQRMQALGGTFLIPVDKASIQLSDRSGERDFGSVGARKMGGRGVQVITGLGLDAQGAPLGVAHQLLWARSDTLSPRRRPYHPSRKRERDWRLPEDRESMRWVDVIDAIHALAQEHAPAAHLWFQLDREGDFWGVHQRVAELGVWATVRMNASHVVRDDKGRKQPLEHWLRQQPIACWLDLAVPAHDGRPQRTARLSVRFARAHLRLPITKSRCAWVEKWFVLVDEPSRPQADNRIRWYLATTRPVDGLEDALAVVEAYKRRWRIEDFHRAWKSGCCNIESSQLQSLRVFHRWAILTSSMAARAEHIKHYSRDYPDAPATLVYTPEEIDLVIAWRTKTAPKAAMPYVPGDVPTIREMTRWVAGIGGFMKSSKCAPGTVTISRGLQKLELMLIGRRLAEPRIKKRRISG